VTTYSKVNISIPININIPSQSSHQRALPEKQGFREPIRWISLWRTFAELLGGKKEELETTSGQGVGATTPKEIIDSNVHGMNNQVNRNNSMVTEVWNGPEAMSCLRSFCT
jgi:hypothetical protein